jgi:hypothetical protein
MCGDQAKEIMVSKTANSVDHSHRPSNAGMDEGPWRIGADEPALFLPAGR